MFIEAVEPLNVTVSESNETIRLRPFQPQDLPESQALKLLAKCPGTVRLYIPPSLDALQPGVSISWHSPLFGWVTGQVAMEPEHGWLVIRGHSVTGNLALVNVEWGLRIEKPQQEGNPTRRNGAQNESDGVEHDRIEV